MTAGCKVSPLSGRLANVVTDPMNGRVGPEREDVLARVNPSQHTTYIVRLGVNFTGTLKPEESAHLYDLKLRRAERLRLARLDEPGGTPQ